MDSLIFFNEYYNIKPVQNPRLSSMIRRHKKHFLRAILLTAVISLILCGCTSVKEKYVQ